MLTATPDSSRVTASSRAGWTSAESAISTFYKRILQLYVREIPYIRVEVFTDTGPDTRFADRYSSNSCSALCSPALELAGAYVYDLIYYVGLYEDVG